MHRLYLELHPPCFFTTIDFRGFDPSTLTDLFYAFPGRKNMTTIYADSRWTLPLSGLTGSQRFHSCSTSLVSGNGTAWASNKTAYTYFRINTASTPGCIMATWASGLKTCRNPLRCPA